MVARLESVEAPAGEVDAVSGETVAVDAEKREMLRNLVEQSGPELSPGEKDMQSYADVMASSMSDLERTGKLCHNILTGDAPPICQPVRRIPLQHREEVRKLLDNMLERGVTEPLTSPWASPIVLVRKKDGTRFCVDYRKLNDVT